MHKTAVIASAGAAYSAWVIAAGSVVTGISSSRSEASSSVCPARVSVCDRLQESSHAA